MMKRNELFRQFTKKVNYSSCNEDTRSELKALRITREDIVLSISGSGARSLDLLVSRPKKVISIDMNPLQNYLLELKIAAIKNLPYGEFLGFLGVRESRMRLSIYDGLRSDLSSEAKEYWDGQFKALKRGILYQGRWERYFRTLSLIVKLFRGEKIKKLFTFTDLEEQMEFCLTKWNTKGWRKFIQIVCHRFFWKYVFQDPGFYRFVPESFPVGNYIYDCMSRTLETYLAKENHFFSLLVHNKYVNEGSLPLHLQEKHYPKLKKNVSRIEIVTDSLQNYLRKLPEKSIHKFSLSDISSYTSEEDYLSILESCVRAAAPDALFCLRHFLVKRKIPQALEHKFQVLNGLGKELERTDMSYAFTFDVGKIV
jgi:S-adenosylmethionine-diacylglycerol 3-amino-3-carboxypropyl transferase